MTLNIFDWRTRFAREGLTPSLRAELREMLTPRVRIRPPYRWVENDAEDASQKRISDVVNWDIVLRAEHAQDALKELSEQEAWREVVHELLPDATLLLKDALDLMRELEGADDRSDRSYSAQPSISKHQQNRGFNDWTVLIELTRDAWVSCSLRSPEIARLEAERWMTFPYPLFKRLSFFAATETDLFSPEKAMSWLLSNDGWWLWSNETLRESMRLLVNLAPLLTPNDSERLQKVILAGPPRELFRDDVEFDRLTRAKDRYVWLRLSKIKSVTTLTADAINELSNLSKRYPEWHLEPDERDEFLIWMGSGDERREFRSSPKQRRELEQFLREVKPGSPWQEDDWRSRCVNDFPRAATALLSLSMTGDWPAERWREALQAWSTETHAARSWRCLGPLLLNAPDEFAKAIAHSLSGWLETVAKSIVRQETTFFRLIFKILDLHRNDAIEDDEDITFRAINHPVGQAADAALRWWYRQKLQDEQGLSPEVVGIFTEICDPEVPIFQYGRIQLSINVIALFRVDVRWTATHLLPYFDWSWTMSEARAVWCGFLISPRLHKGFISATKPALLATASHYSRLGKLGRQYSALLTYSALELGELFTVNELSAATSSLPESGLEEAAHSLTLALEGAADQRAEYWRNRVLPYLRRIWPKGKDRLTPKVAHQFALLCAAAGEAFPEAVAFLRDWIRRSADANFVVHRLYVEKLPARFPDEALDFLDAVVDDSVFWLPLDLKSCVEMIGEARPELRQDARLIRLMVLIRRVSQ